MNSLDMYKQLLISVTVAYQAEPANNTITTRQMSGDQQCEVECEVRLQR